MRIAFRSLIATAAVVSLTYGAMYAFVVAPPQRTSLFIEALNAPGGSSGAGGLRMGRSVAATLASQAALLPRRQR